MLSLASNGVHCIVSCILLIKKLVINNVIGMENNIFYL
jgi:hypothetical protein